MGGRLDAAKQSIHLRGGPPLLVGGLLILAALFLPWVYKPGDDPSAYGGDNPNAFEYMLGFAAAYVGMGLWSLHLAIGLAGIKDRAHFKPPTVFAWITFVPVLGMVLASPGWTAGRELGPGTTLTLIGLIVMLVGLSRAKRARVERVRAPTTPPPAGWYADPEGQGARWWDGQSWTEHRQQ